MNKNLDERVHELFSNPQRPSHWDKIYQIIPQKHGDFGIDSQDPDRPIVKTIMKDWKIVDYKNMTIREYLKNQFNYTDENIDLLFQKIIFKIDT